GQGHWKARQGSACPDRPAARLRYPTAETSPARTQRPADPLLGLIRPTQVLLQRGSQRFLLLEPATAGDLVQYGPCAGRWDRSTCRPHTPVPAPGDMAAPQSARFEEWADRVRGSCASWWSCPHRWVQESL